MRPEKIPRPAPDQLPAIIESLLFVAEEPQEIGTLSKTLSTPRQGIERAIEILIESTADRGIFVQRHDDLVQLSTTPEAAPYIEHFLEVEHGRLSRASLETLAIIAYRQPATRATVEGVRGVNSDHSVATLIARGLVEDVGRVPGPGRAVLFGTTLRFLEYFGLQQPDDLPPLPELEQEEGEDIAEEPSADISADESDTDALPAEFVNEDASETDEPATELQGEAESELSIVEP
jgi:segregation and condensation protein B